MQVLATNKSWLSRVDDKEYPTDSDTQVGGQIRTGAYEGERRWAMAVVPQGLRPSAGT